MSIKIPGYPMLKGLTPNRKYDDEDDIRFTENEIPACLGKEPSKETLKLWGSNFGWVYLGKITNNSDRVVHYRNPYSDVSGDILPGDSESNYCKGYIPLWSYIERYKITYYNTSLSRKMTMLLKDLEGDWLVSFWQDETEDEDIRSFTPPENVLGSTTIELTINNNGYSNYHVIWGKEQGSLTWN